MIVIVVSSKPAALVTLIESHGNAVIHVTDDLRSVVLPLLEMSAHVVFIDEATNKTERLLKELKQQFSKTRFVILGESRNHDKIIQRELTRSPQPPDFAQHIPEDRQIILDPRYQCSFAKVKTDLSKQAGDAEDLETQALRLTWMLRTALQNRARASAYRDAISNGEGYEFQEISYRLLKGEVHAVAYARYQIGKYLGQLSHYVAGVEIDCLPIPGESLPAVRFVEYGANLRTLYALLCLSLYGFHEAFYKEAFTNLGWFHTSEGPDQLRAIGVQLTGSMFQLRGIMTSHMHAIDWLIHPRTPDLLGVKGTSYMERARHCFRDFWGFEKLFNEPERLRQVLYTFSAEERPELPEELRPPSFADFYNRVNEMQKEHEKGPQNSTTGNQL